MEKILEQFTFKNVCIFIGCLFILAMLMSSVSKGGRSTDGVFESATQKLDRGEPLNGQERKRIDDILNWHKQKR